VCFCYSKIIFVKEMCDLEKVPIFCDTGDCGACDGKCCWNDCEDAACQNICTTAKRAHEIYADDNELINELYHVGEREDNWLMVVAAEKIRDLKENSKP